MFFGVQGTGGGGGGSSEWARLGCKDVKFLMEPTVINPTTRICFIEAPDGVSVELLERKD